MIDIEQQGSSVDIQSDDFAPMSRIQKLKKRGQYACIQLTVLGFVWLVVSYWLDVAFGENATVPQSYNFTAAANSAHFREAVSNFPSNRLPMNMDVDTSNDPAVT